MISRAIAVAAVLLAHAAASSAQPESPRNANYNIVVTLDPAARTLTGSETLEWINISGAPATELQFHLYWNAWRDRRSTWMREHTLSAWWPQVAARRPEDFGGIDVTRLTVFSPMTARTDLTKAARFIAPDDGNQHDRTVMAVPLPAAVAPGQKVTIDIEFTARIPRPFARTGAVGDFFFIAQWFPKIGVLDPTGKWNTHQFHASTEFFADFGIYYVQMTVPRGWLLGATGRERSRRDNADGTTTHNYYQEDVHDFAWTTSPDFIERRERFEHEGLPRVDLRLLLLPGHEGQASRHFEGARATLRYYGENIGAYPYGHLTIVDPAFQSATDGMEYPTLFTTGTRWLMPRADTYLEDTLVHETGHQWWYGMVATNEFEDAWMDEGINQYVNARIMAEQFPHGREVRRYFGGFVPWVLDDVRWDRLVDGDVRPRYFGAPTVDIQSTPSFRYWPRDSVPITYAKPALWLHTLERALGWTTMQRALAAFFEKWRYKHPRPGDFFSVINEVSGRDLSPFFDQVYRTSTVFDYGVESVTASESEGGRVASHVVVRRFGDGIFPVTVLITLANGEQRRMSWDGVGRWQRFTVDHARPAVAAQVDPEQVLLLDTSFTNNSVTTQAQGWRAANKWAATWMVWLQDQLLTWAALM